MVWMRPNFRLWSIDEGGHWACYRRVGEVRIDMDD